MLVLPPHVKAMRAKANAMAHEGMRLHGFDDEDHATWSVFYNSCLAYVQRSSHLPAKKNDVALARVYELAAERATKRENLLG